MTKMKWTLAVVTDESVSCPHCKSDDLDYAEYEVITRHTSGIDPDTGVFQIDSHFECEGDGENPHFICRDCGKPSGIPGSLEISFN